MAVRQLRMCDVCETDYNPENPGWMIMSVPNAPEEMGPVEYDFCSFNCLHDFVTSPDDDEEETAESLGQRLDMGTPVQVTTNIPEDIEVPEYVRKAAETPLPRATGAPTLADALANGLKPDAPR